MQFTIRFTESAVQDLEAVPAFYKRQIVDAIKKHLPFDALTPSRNRKLIKGTEAPWDALEPFWELRVGPYPMKVVSLRDAKASLSSYLETAQRERVLITTHGKPTALVIGVRCRDLEAVISGGEAHGPDRALHDTLPRAPQRVSQGT